MKTCWRCGTQNADDAKFCNHCGSGQSIPPQQPQPYHYYPPKKKSKTGSVIIIIIAAIVGLSLLNNLFKNPESEAEVTSKPSIRRTTTLKPTTQSSDAEDVSTTTTEYVPKVPDFEFTDMKMYEPNSAGGVSFDIDLKNNSNKTVKYARFKVIVANRVGDPIRDEISFSDDYYFTLSMVGPIEPNSVGGVGEFWDCAFYNSTAYSYDIHEISIEYTDGTTEAISKYQCREMIDAYKNQ